MNKIKVPRIGMKVMVVDPLHCFGDTADNHGGQGVISEIDHANSFRVKMDENLEASLWRCRQCTKEIFSTKKGEVMDKSYVLDDKARTALIASRTEKWEGIKHGTVVDLGGDNCALCGEYRLCDGCPIYTKTGRMDCDGTPYKKWLSHQNKEHSMCNKRIIHCRVCAEIADEEIAFLAGLETEMKEKKPDDVVLSFENQAEYVAFVGMIMTAHSVPEVVDKARRTSSVLILRKWMQRVYEELLDKDASK